MRENDDADTFLEYALDLIDRGETANYVMEEVGTTNAFIYNFLLFFRSFKP